jgi:hypothetical protein
VLYVHFGFVLYVYMCVPKMALPNAMIIVWCHGEFASLDEFCSMHELDVMSVDVAGSPGFGVFDEATLDRRHKHQGHCEQHNGKERKGNMV